jgi:hypothetical protein
VTWIENFHIDEGGREALSSEYVSPCESLTVIDSEVVVRSRCERRSSPARVPPG